MSPWFRVCVLLTQGPLRGQSWATCLRRPQATWPNMVGCAVYCIARLRNAFSGVIWAQYFGDECCVRRPCVSVHACACGNVHPCMHTENQRSSRKISRLLISYPKHGCSPSLSASRGSHGFETGTTCVVAKGPSLGGFAWPQTRHFRIAWHMESSLIRVAWFPPIFAGYFREDTREKAEAGHVPAGLTQNLTDFHCFHDSPHVFCEKE